MHNTLCCSVKGVCAEIYGTYSLHIQSPVGCGPSAIFTGKVLGKYKVEENGEQLRYSKRDRQHVVTVVFSWSIRGFLWSGVFFTISINIRCQKAGLGLHIWRWVILQFFLASQRKGINVFFLQKSSKNWRVKFTAVWHNACL